MGVWSGCLDRVDKFAAKLFISKKNIQPDDFDVWVFEHHPLAVQAVDPQDGGQLLENQDADFAQNRMLKRLKTFREF